MFTRTLGATERASDLLNDRMPPLTAEYICGFRPSMPVSTWSQLMLMSTPPSGCPPRIAPDSRAISQVELQDGCTAPKGLDDGRHLLRPFDVGPVRHGDVGASPRQRQRNGTADATRRARHQHGTPAQRSLVAHQSIIVACS